MDRAREPFDEAKLRSGMVRALERRPVSSEAIEESIARIIHDLQTMGEREIPSRLIGEKVMEELRELDEVGLCALRIRLPSLSGRDRVPGRDPAFA